LLKILDNWCPEVYRSVFIDRYNNDHIRVSPCCQATSSNESAEQFNFVSSPTLSYFRDQFNQGNKPPECKRCWTAEESGHKSRRQSAIEFFNLPEVDTTVQLESIDHSATWACNMACIMCSPINSSLWAKEVGYKPKDLDKIGRRFQNDNNIINKLNVSRVKKIHYNGGEPFLNNHQLDLLKILEQTNVLNNLFISYNTNGSIFPDQEIIEYWKKARLVKLFFSIDAVGSAFEYIRWPGKWQEISNNIQLMKNTLPSNVMFGLNLTVGNYNILELQDLWTWFDQVLKTNREGDPSDFNWQLANNFNPSEVKLEVKQQAIDQLQEIPALAGIVNYLENSLESNINNQWITKLDVIDERRNTNWRQILKIGRYY
jgi:hypothetical protein